MVSVNNYNDDIGVNNHNNDGKFVTISEVFTQKHWMSMKKEYYGKMIIVIIMTIILQ